MRRAVLEIETPDVEIDTLIFDTVFLFAMIYCAAALRARAPVTPLFVLLVLMLAITTIPMVYAVSNFGTLFRLRQMIYVIAALLPVTLRPATT